jgi:hypothetical protein
MDEEEFDSLMQSRPFGTGDALRADARLRRCTALGMALWGRTLEDLQRQLLAPFPEIPSGFDLAALRELQQSALEISACFSHPRSKWLSRFSSFSPAISVGTQSFTVWEARCEIVRRAIEYLERH